jgi:hypothetical protein
MAAPCISEVRRRAKLRQKGCVSLALRLAYLLMQARKSAPLREHATRIFSSSDQPIPFFPIFQHVKTFGQRYLIAAIHI